MSKDFPEHVPFFTDKRVVALSVAMVHAEHEFDGPNQGHVLVITHTGQVYGCPKGDVLGENWVEYLDIVCQRKSTP